MCAFINNVQQQFDSFFHQYVNMAWTTKGTKSHLLSVLHSFYKHKVSMALRRAQATYISNRVVIVGEGYSRLGVLTSLPPLFLINMLHGTSGGFQYLMGPCPPCGPPLFGRLFAWTLVLTPYSFSLPFLGVFFL